jgi:hypothetical protein
MIELPNSGQSVTSAVWTRMAALDDGYVRLDPHEVAHLLEERTQQRRQREEFQTLRIDAAALLAELAECFGDDEVEFAHIRAMRRRLVGDST